MSEKYETLRCDTGNKLCLSIQRSIYLEEIF